MAKKKTRHQESIDIMLTSTNYVDELFKNTQFVNRHYNPHQAQAIISSLNAYDEKLVLEKKHQGDIAKITTDIRKGSKAYSRLMTGNIFKAAIYAVNVAAHKVAEGITQRFLLKATEKVVGVSNYNTKKLMEHSNNEKNLVGVGDPSNPTMKMYLKPHENNIGSAEHYLPGPPKQIENK